MSQANCTLLVAAVVALLLSGASPTAARAEGHGPSASAAAFPSHDFSLRPHDRGVELSFHYGLLQPLLLHGFNAAADLRIGRFIASYSHGQGLVISDAPGALTAEQEAAGMRIVAPFSTGGGIGLTLFDELYVMADLKVHRFEASAGRAVESYTTVTVGAEIGWRFFVWRGLHVTPVVRYWPNVWDSAPAGGVMVETVDGGLVRHEVAKQGMNGLFANVLVGWSFDL